jgi:hypothetical protein
MGRASNVSRSGTLLETIGLWNHLAGLTDRPVGYTMQLWVSKVSFVRKRSKQILDTFDKSDITGLKIDFVAVYRELIAPARSKKADPEPLRANEEMTGGIINKPMFAGKILCEYAIVDLNTANAKERKPVNIENFKELVMGKFLAHDG